MRTSVVVAVVALIAAPAFADRSTVATIGVTGDGRAIGSSYATAGDNSTSPYGGMRLMLAWEDRPIEYSTSVFSYDTRLVPELLTGFVANDRRAEGMIGAGLRGEVQLANSRRHMRIAMYTAARAEVIGKHQDPAAEFVVGEYILLGTGRTRFGWEGGAILRERNDATFDRSKELDAVLTVYVGWRL